MSHQLWFRTRTHTHTCVRIRTWSVCQHNPHKVEHLHSHSTGRTKQSNFHIEAVEHAHSILDCLRLQKIEKATCLGRTLTQTWMCCAKADFMLFCSFPNQSMTNYSFFVLPVAVKIRQFARILLINLSPHCYLKNLDFQHRYKNFRIVL